MSLTPPGLQAADFFTGFSTVGIPLTLNDPFSARVLCLSGSATVCPTVCPRGCRVAALLQCLGGFIPRKSFTRMSRHTVPNAYHTQPHRVSSWDKTHTWRMSDCQEGPVNTHGDRELTLCGSPDTCHTYSSRHADGAQLLQHHLCARLSQSDEKLHHCICATEVFDNQPLLGVMAGLLDEIASTHVFGNYGSKDRPRGLVTLSIIQDMEKHQRLSSSSNMTGINPCKSGVKLVGVALMSL